MVKHRDQMPPSFLRILLEQDRLEEKWRCWERLYRVYQLLSRSIFSLKPFPVTPGLQSLWLVSPTRTKTENASRVLLVLKLVDRKKKQKVSFDKSVFGFAGRIMVRWNTRSAERGVRGVESAECRKWGVWKMRSMESEECGKCGVWKVRSMENAECGKCGV